MIIVKDLASIMSAILWR